MNQILTDPTISSIYNLSWQQVNHIKQIPQLLNNANWTPTTINQHTDAEKGQIATLYQRLRSLEWSVQSYNPNWLRFILHLITGRWCKIKQMQRTLPAVVQAVAQIADPIFDANKTLNLANATPVTQHKFELITKALAKADPSNNEIVLVEKLRTELWTILEAIEKQEQNKIVSSMNKIRQEHAALNIARHPVQNHPLTPIIESLSLYFNEVNSIPFFQDKGTVQHLLEQTFDIDFEKMRSHIDMHSTAGKVHEFFKTTLEKLRRGVDAPLPIWYHATGKSDPETTPMKSMTSIINSKAIKKSWYGAQGAGTYISSQSEWGFGPYCFCIDSEVFTGKSGTFQPLTYSIWGCVHHDVPVTPSTIAFIATSSVDAVRAQLTTLGSDIPVVDRETSAEIRRILVEVNIPQDLPSTWKPYSGYSYGTLPPNMRLRRAWPLQDLLGADVSRATA